MQKEGLGRAESEREREARVCERSESHSERRAGVTLQPQTQNKQKSPINKQ